MSLRTLAHVTCLGLWPVAGQRGWNRKLYEGSAAHYVQGRLPYPPEVAEVLREELRLNGTGRLLDVGSGPGSLTLLLAPHFQEAVGVDPDPGMIAEAANQASSRGIGNARWAMMRAEELPGDLGTFRVATFAQSFHWMDRARVATAVRAMLEPGGSWVHVGATTHQGLEDADRLPFPSRSRTLSSATSVTRGARAYPARTRCLLQLASQDLVA